ncbi:MAG: hemolysin III family protein [Verrucomicrobia bacterium]|nr:hemolysin III family protein [Verrucomicrobiota bacterium]
MSIPSRTCLPRRASLKLREPFSGLSHLSGAVLGIAALVVLVRLAQGKPWHVSAFGIYGAALILLYLASALYHLLPVNERWVERLRIVDHVGIYLLIAGTYTPICLVPLRGGWGWSLLGVVWGLALFGSACEIAWRTAPRWLGRGLYLVMGWLAVIAFGPLTRTLTGAGLEWLLAGGIVYTVGAVIYATERPRLWPGVFGAHDLWHLLVLSGSVCHLVMMFRFIVPLP